MTLDSPLDRIKSKNLTSGSTVERRSEQPPRLSAFLFWSTCFVLSRLKKNDSMRCFFPDLGAADKVLSAVLMIFSVANTIVLVTNKVLSDRLTVLIAMELSVVPKFRPFDVQSEPFIE